jgi:hypothetical protein
MTNLVQPPKNLDSHVGRARHNAALLLSVTVSLFVVLTTTLSTPAQAVTHSARVSTTHRHHGDQRWDRSTRAMHALVHAQKTFSPSTPALERPDATLALRRLWLLKDALSPADRAAAEKLAGRPIKPAAVGNDHILIHYDPAELSPAGYTIDQALATLEYVSETYANSGYRRPKADGTKGGDSRVDIYLDQLPPGLYGYCTTDQRKLVKPGRFDVWAYCVLDADYAGFPEHTPLENLEVTAAHEYYHATQFAYDIADDSWFLEATAVTMEDELYDDVNDNYQYLRRSPITMPGRPMDKFEQGGTFHYGVWSFFRYLIERNPEKVGSLPKLLLDMWKNADSSKGPRKDLYSTQAIDRALKKDAHTSLAEQFANYSAALGYTHQTFSEGTELNYPDKRLADKVDLRAGKSKTFRGTLDQSTSATYQFVPRGATKRLKLRFTMGPTSHGSKAVVMIHRTDGSLDAKKVRISARGRGKASVAFDTDVADVEVTLVNASFRFRDCYRQESSYPCQGVPVDQKQRVTLQAEGT